MCKSLKKCHLHCWHVCRQDKAVGGGSFFNTLQREMSQECRRASKRLLWAVNKKEVDNACIYMRMFVASRTCVGPKGACWLCNWSEDNVLLPTKNGQKLNQQPANKSCCTECIVCDNMYVFICFMYTLLFVCTLQNHKNRMSQLDWELSVHGHTHTHTYPSAMYGCHMRNGCKMPTIKASSPHRTTGHSLSVLMITNRRCRCRRHRWQNKKHWTWKVNCYYRTAGYLLNRTYCPIGGLILISFIDISLLPRRGLT